MKDGNIVVCGSPKQLCLWGQRRRKMWLGKVAPALKMLVVLHGRKNQNQKTTPKLVKLEEESVPSSLVPKGTSWQMGMDPCKFLQPPGLWFNTSLSFCCSMIFESEFIPILLSLSIAVIFFLNKLNVFFPFLFIPCHPAVYKIGLSLSAWGVFCSSVVKIVRGWFELFYFEEWGSHVALWNPSTM